MNHFSFGVRALRPLHDIDRGGNTPKKFIAVIEIPLGSNVKYERTRKALYATDSFMHDSSS
jgi:inorganic pyrophosphatase